jgi:hypothetical protein
MVPNLSEEATFNKVPKSDKGKGRDSRPNKTKMPVGENAAGSETVICDQIQV